MICRKIPNAPHNIVKNVLRILLWKKRCLYVVSNSSIYFF